jgi:hypothetical protein
LNTTEFLKSFKLFCTGELPWRAFLLIQRNNLFILSLKSEKFGIKFRHFLRMGFFYVCYLLAKLRLNIARSTYLVADKRGGPHLLDHEAQKIR